MGRSVRSPASCQIPKSFGGRIARAHTHTYTYTLCNGLRHVLGQSKIKGGQNNHKDLHGVRIRKRTEKEGRIPKKTFLI